MKARAANPFRLVSDFTPSGDQPVAIEWVQKDAARGDHRIRLAQWATGSPAPCVVGAGPGIGMGPEE